VYVDFQSFLITRTVGTDEIKDNNPTTQTDNVPNWLIKQSQLIISPSDLIAYKQTKKTTTKGTSNFIDIFFQYITLYSDYNPLKN